MKRTQRVFGDIDALSFVDDRLDDERRAAFQSHLAHEPETLARVQLWQRQNDFIRAAFATPQSEPVPLWLRLSHIETDREPAAASDNQPRVPVPAKSPPQRPRRGSSSTLKALASAALLICIGTLAIVATNAALTTPRGDLERVGRQMPPVSAFSGPAGRAIDGFRTFAQDPIRPVEVSTSDQPLLERWLMRRLMLPIHAPDLADLGWTLLGGRLTPGDGEPAALLVYESPARQRLAVYAQRATTGHAPKAAGLGAPGLSLMSWTSDAVSYVVVSDKDQSWMVQNADVLRDRVQSASAD